MRRTLIPGAVVGLVAALSLAAPAHAAPATDPAPTATVGVFHGIPNLPVDVYVGKDKVLDDFQPGTFGGPLKVPTGHYLIRVTPADATSAKEAVLKARFGFQAGRNYSVIAHLTAKGAPTLTKYRNDLSKVGHDEARVTVRHVAAAPPVRVLLDNTVAISKLKNPQEAKAVLPADTYSVKVKLAQPPRTRVFGPTDLEFKAGTNTIVYAYGSAKDGTLAFITRVLPLQS